MREKYVDERYPLWFTFPPSIVTSTGDWTARLSSMADAELLAREHNAVQAALVRCALAFAEASPEAFTKFWYGSELNDSPGRPRNEDPS